MSVVFENNRHFFCFFIVFALILLLNCLFTVRGLRRGVRVLRIARIRGSISGILIKMFFYL